MDESIQHGQFDMRFSTPQAHQLEVRCERFLFAMPEHDRDQTIVTGSTVEPTVEFNIVVYLFGMRPHDELPPVLAKPEPLSLKTLLTGTAMVLSSFILVLLSIHYKLFWSDELLEYYSDTKPGIGAVVFGQLHYPFSLEPPAFHILLHLMHGLLPIRAEFSLRILSALSFAVIQVCIFRIVYRLAGKSRAALFAMALPFLFATFNYAAEARVYSLLTALFAAALVCYQIAIEDNPRSPTTARAGIFLLLSAGVLVHYFGIFLPLPLLAGEVVRGMYRRRLDWPMLFAIAGALLMALFDLPFMHALKEIRANYYSTGETAWRMIPFTYAWFLAPGRVYQMVQNHQRECLVYCGGTIAVVLFLWALLRRRSSYPQLNQSAIFTVIAAGSLLPLINVFVAHYFTHAYVPRYSLPAVVSISAGLGLIFEPWLRRRTFFCWTLAILLAVCTFYGGRAFHRFSLGRRNFLADMAATSELTTALAGVEDQHIYTQAAAEFLTTYYYADPTLQDRMVGVESKEEELLWLHRDPGSVFMRNIGITTSVPVMTYECLQQQRGPHIFIVYRDPEEEWIYPEIDSKDIMAERMGKALGGTIYRIRFSHSEVDTSKNGDSAGNCIRQLKQIAP